MHEKSTEAQPDLTSHHRRASRNMDWIAAVSFVGAGVAGLFTIANNIRNRFYHAFVLGYKESPTVFTPLVKSYTDAEKGEFAKVTKQLEEGLITPVEYSAKHRGLAKEFRGKLHAELLERFHIPSDGWRGWTEGTVKRWREMGVTSRIESTAGIASLTAISIAAITMLRHNKRVMDRIENRVSSPDESVQR